METIIIQTKQQILDRIHKLKDFVSEALILQQNSHTVFIEFYLNISR